MKKRYKISERKLTYEYASRCYEYRKEKINEVSHGECKIIFGNPIDEEKRSSLRREMQLSDVAKNKLEQKKARRFL